MTYDQATNRIVTATASGGGQQQAQQQQQSKTASAKTAPMQPMSCDPEYDPGCGDPLNMPPVSAPGGPYGGQVGQNVQFDGTGSYDPDGSITDWIWNFGDGTADIPRWLGKTLSFRRNRS